MNGFDFFSPNAKKVIQIANREAHGFNHNAIGTEHLLLGIVSLHDGIIAAVNETLGLDIKAVRFEIEKLVSHGEGTTESVGMLPLTPRSKKVLQFAATEARNLNTPLVDAEHILLAILREGEGIAAKALENLGITLDKALAAVSAATESAPSSGDAPDDPAPGADDDEDDDAPPPFGRRDEDGQPMTDKQLRDEVQKVLVIFVQLPVVPAQFVVLTVGIVVPQLGFPQLVCSEHHGHSVREEQRSNQVAPGAFTKKNCLLVACRTFDSAIPAIVVVLTVIVAF